MSISAVIDELYMVFTFAEKSKIAFVYFGKRPTEKKDGERINAFEPKVFYSLASLIQTLTILCDKRLIRHKQYIKKISIN